MTEHRDFKRLVRAEAAKTGESYQAARRRLQRHPRPASDSQVTNAPTGTATSLLETFARTGIVALHEVFSADEATEMRAAVWRDLYHTDGVQRDDPTTWHRQTPVRKLARAKRDRSFQAMFGEPVRRLADALLGEGWTISGGFGNLLVSFPDTSHWRLPGKEGSWHSDLPPYAIVDPLPSLRLFVVFGDVPPQGGGTLLVAGSHRMVGRFVETYPEFARSNEGHDVYLRSNPWLAELTQAHLPAAPDLKQDEDRRRRFMDTATDVDGIPAQVIEACGKPGDVCVCHPWTIHCKPPHAGDHPRFLRSPSLFRPEPAD